MTSKPIGLEATRPRMWAAWVEAGGQLDQVPADFQSLVGYMVRVYLPQLRQHARNAESFRRQRNEP